MNTRPVITTILLAVLFSGLAWISFLPVQAQSAPPTPTYDPFAEPPLSENPSELELGIHTYWHYCMPCHGDVGQGLTDEFRMLWEDTHQNCWAAGCHSGNYSYDSFPVPTVIPPVADREMLSRHSPNSLFEYLRITHPPEDPGLLSDEEYRSLITFLYHLNDMPMPAYEPTATPTQAPTITPTASPTRTPEPLPAEKANPLCASLFILPGAILSGSLLATRLRRKRG